MLYKTKKMKTEANVFKIKNFDERKLQETKSNKAISTLLQQGTQESMKKMKEKILKMREKLVKEEIVKHPKKKLEDGDLVEFTKESGDRTNGVFIIRKSGKSFKVKELVDGNIPDIFSLTPEKPPGYWNFVRFEYASWYHINHPEPLAAKYWKKIKAKDIETIDGKQFVDIGWTTLGFDMSKPVLLKFLRKVKTEKALYFVNSEEDNNKIETSEGVINLSGKEPRNTIYLDSWLTPYFYDLPDWEKQETQKKVKSKVRPSPTQSATLFQVGQKKKGNDGNMYQVVTNKNGVKRWKK